MDLGLDNLAGAVGESEGSNTGDSLQQYEPCKIKGCKYLNEEGFCSRETCVVLNENPSTAMMVTKNCMFCGSKFTTNLDSMQIQLCPECLAEAIGATKRGGGEDETNALSGTVDVANTKLKAKSAIAKSGMLQSLKGFVSEGGVNLGDLNLDGLNLGGLDLASVFGDLFGENGLGSISDFGNIDFSNIAGDLENLSSMDLSGAAEDLGAGLAKSAASQILGQSGGHSCMFCGASIVKNPSLFFPCCPKCFANLVIVTTVCSPAILSALAVCSPKNLVLAGTASHCYACEDW